MATRLFFCPIPSRSLAWLEDEKTVAQVVEIAPNSSASDMVTKKEAATFDSLEECRKCGQTASNQQLEFLKCVACHYIHSWCSGCAESNGLLFSCTALGSNGAPCCDSLEPLEMHLAVQEIKDRQYQARICA